MLKTFVEYGDIIKSEPALDEYIQGGGIQFDDVKDEAFKEMLIDFKNRGYTLRNLCTPLVLQASTTKTSAFDGLQSDIDKIERLRLVIIVTALTGNAIFSLEGIKYEDTNENYDVNDYTEIQKYTITQPGTYNYLIDSTYEYYRLRLLQIGTTVTYSSYMQETIFDTLHIYKIRAMIYRDLWATQGDLYQGKYNEYAEAYDKLINESVFFTDLDESGSIETDESQQDSRRVTFKP